MSKKEENIIVVEERKNTGGVYKRVRSNTLDKKKKSNEDEIVERFEAQLVGEYEMFEMQDYSELENNYLRNLEDPNARFFFASFLVKSSHATHLLNAIRILEGLLDPKVKTDPTLRSGVLYYLGVANYKLTFYKQARRYVKVLLEEQPNNIQGENLSIILKRKKRRVIGVFVDEKFESTLAFHKAIELIKKSDLLILISIIDIALVESQLVHYKNQPPYPSLIEAKAEEIAEKIQHNCQKICRDRKINFNYMYEYGNPKLLLCDVIEQENINIIVVANSHDRKGLFSRSDMIEQLLLFGKCDIHVVSKH